MRLKLWPSTSAHEHLSEIEELYPSASFQAWIVLKGNEFVGFAEASIRPFANGCESRPVVFLEGVWVDEAIRKLGLGRMLLDPIESWGFQETERVVYFRKKLLP